MSEPLSWHQMQAAKRAYRTRNMPAHILEPDLMKGMVALCGRKHPEVTIDPWHRNNPENLPCKKCVKLANKLGLSTESPSKYPPIQNRPLSLRP